MGITLSYISTVVFFIKDNIYIKFLTLGVNLNNPGAMCDLAYVYSMGEGITQDYQKAIKLLKKASKLNDPIAISNLGYLYEHGKGVNVNRKKAIKLYKRAIKLGESSSMNNLALIHEKNGNFKKALKLYKQSVKLECGGAMYNLSRMYFYGYGTKKNNKKVIKLLYKSYKLNFNEALTILRQNFGNYFNYIIDRLNKNKKINNRFYKGLKL